MVYSFYFYYAIVSIHETKKYLVNYRVIEGSKEKKTKPLRKRRRVKSGTQTLWIASSEDMQLHMHL